MIGLVYRDSLPQGTADELDQLVQGLVGMLYQEHDPDGTHTNITADSLTLNPVSVTNGVTGAFTFQDRLGNKTVVERDEVNGSQITLYNGETLLIRWVDAQNILFDMVKLGHISFGTGEGFGIELMARVAGLPNSFNNWAILSGVTNASPGARMLIANLDNVESPISLRYRSSGGVFYEWMKTTGGSGPSVAEVNLGSGFDSSQQGYWDNLYVKAISLGSGAGPLSFGLGTWNPTAFSAGDYTASGAMTWTVGSGDVATNATRFVGPSCLLTVMLNTTSIAGTPDTELRVAIPNSLVPTMYAPGSGYAFDNGVFTRVRCQANISVGYISVFRDDGAVWTASTNNTLVYFTIEFPVS